MIDLTPRPWASPDDAIPSVLTWGRPPPEGVIVTITIPTYNRSHLLPFAIESTMAQDTDLPTWIIVTDNASDEAHSLKTLSWLDARRPLNLSYYRNARNIGLFPNWNRGPALATSRWVTVLNDDDLLSPSFVRDAVSCAEKFAVDAVVTRVTSFDTRDAAAAGANAGSGRVRLTNPLRDLMKFRGRQVYRPTVGDLFWGNELGNSLGLLIDRAQLRALGGYVAADGPAADYVFNVRLVLHASVVQLDKIEGYIRIAENFSMRADILEEVVKQDHRLREAILSSGRVPAQWRRYLPAIVAEQIAVVRSTWGVELDHALIADSLGIDRVPYDKLTLKARRLLYRGF